MSINKLYSFQDQSAGLKDFVRESGFDQTSKYSTPLWSGFIFLERLVYCNCSRKDILDFDPVRGIVKVYQDRLLEKF